MQRLLHKIIKIEHIRLPFSNLMSSYAKDLPSYEQVTEDHLYCDLSNEAKEQSRKVPVHLTASTSLNTTSASSPTVESTVEVRLDSESFRVGQSVTGTLKISLKESVRIHDIQIKLFGIETASYDYERIYCDGDGRYARKEYRWETKADQRELFRAEISEPINQQVSGTCLGFPFEISLALLQATTFSVACVEFTVEAEVCFSRPHSSRVSLIGKVTPRILPALPSPELLRPYTTSSVAQMMSC